MGRIKKTIGSGTSTGVPEIGCTCPVCTSGDARTSFAAYILFGVYRGCEILIDCMVLTSGNRCYVYLLLRK